MDAAKKEELKAKLEELIEQYIDDVRGMEELNKLRLALQKIDEPSFGICDNCDKPIQEGRLMFLPESTRCIRCAGR